VRQTQVEVGAREDGVGVGVEGFEFGGSGLGGAGGQEREIRVRDIVERMLLDR
jgi:hypothetical protein